MDAKLLKLPVQKVAVRLRYDSDEEIYGEIYLSRHSAVLSGPMTVREMLEEESSFFAFSSDRGDVLLNKSFVEVVRYDANLFPDELAAANLTGQRREMTLDLASGARVVGDLCEDLPPGRARPIDGLNQPGRFVRLRHQNEFLLVNKARILRGGR
jgi:hypothetical protein